MTIRTALTVVVTAVVVGSTSVAFAAASSGTGDDVTACVNRHTGAVRIPGHHEHCKASERKLVWSRRPVAALPRVAFRSNPNPLNFYDPTHNVTGMLPALVYHLPTGQWDAVANFSVSGQISPLGGSPLIDVWCELRNADNGYAGGARAVITPTRPGAVAANLSIDAGFVITDKTKPISVWCRADVADSGGTGITLHADVNQLMATEVGTYV